MMCSLGRRTATRWCCPGLPDTQCPKIEAASLRKLPGGAVAPSVRVRTCVRVCVCVYIHLFLLWIDLSILVAFI